MISDFRNARESVKLFFLENLELAPSTYPISITDFSDALALLAVWRVVINVKKRERRI